MDNIQEAIQAAVDAPEPEAQENSPQKAVESTQEDERHAEQAEAFPKKAVNALSRRDKQILKQKKELAELRQIVESLKNGNASESKSPPKENDFDSYADFLEAKQEYSLGKKLEEREQSLKEQQTKAFEQQQKQMEVAQKAQQIDQLDAQYRESSQDYAQTMDSVDDYIAEIAEDRPEIVEVFMSVADPALAVYALAKQNLLEAVASMSPEKALNYVINAEFWGRQILAQAGGGSANPAPANRQAQTPRSNAPAPIRGVKGTNHSVKSIDNMSVDELHAKFSKD